MKDKCSIIYVHCFLCLIIANSDTFAYQWKILKFYKTNQDQISSSQICTWLMRQNQFNLLCRPNNRLAKIGALKTHLKVSRHITNCIWMPLEQWPPLTLLNSLRQNNHSPEAYTLLFPSNSAPAPFLPNVQVLFSLVWICSGTLTADSEEVIILLQVCVVSTVENYCNHDRFPVFLGSDNKTCEILKLNIILLALWWFCNLQESPN